MEIQKTAEVANNPETEDTIKSAKQNQSEQEVEHCYEQKQEEEEDELRSMLLSDIGDLPLSPPSATQVNFVSYFITGSVLSHSFIHSA